MNTSPISFEELRTKESENIINDCNSAVMIAVKFPQNQDWNEVQEFLADELGFSKGKKLIGCRKITGNMHGNSGRSDYMLEFDNPTMPFNALARLRFSDIKWTSDFIVNFGKDYGYEVD